MQSVKTLNLRRHLNFTACGRNEIRLLICFHRCSTIAVSVLIILSPLLPARSSSPSEGDHDATSCCHVPGHRRVAGSIGCWKRRACIQSKRLQRKRSRPSHPKRATGRPRGRRRLLVPTRRRRGRRTMKRFINRPRLTSTRSTRPMRRRLPICLPRTPNMSMSRVK